MKKILFLLPILLLSCASEKESVTKLEYVHDTLYINKVRVDSFERVVYVADTIYEKDSIVVNRTDSLVTRDAWHVIYKSVARDNTQTEVISDTLKHKEKTDSVSVDNKEVVVKERYIPNWVKVIAFVICPTLLLILIAIFYLKVKVW